MLTAAFYRRRKKDIQTLFMFLTRLGKKKKALKRHQLHVDSMLCHVNVVKIGFFFCVFKKKKHLEDIKALKWQPSWWIMRKCGTIYRVHWTFRITQYAGKLCDTKARKVENSWKYYHIKNALMFKFWEPFQSHFEFKWTKLCIQNHQPLFAPKSAFWYKIPFVLMH